MRFRFFRWGFLWFFALSCVVTLPTTHAASPSSLNSMSSANSANSASCTATARQLINELLPFAEQIAGKTLDVKLPRNVVLFWIPPNGATEEQATAHVFGNSIQIHKAFCIKDDTVKAAIIAHELGHIIEGESSQSSPWIMAEKWADRITEIRATRHAIDIFHRSGRQAHWGNPMESGSIRRGDLLEHPVCDDL